MDDNYAWMHKKPLDWNHMRTVLAIERAGNLSRAAKTLAINQSTASRHLASLEYEIGAPLFIRSKTSMEITEAGRAVVAEAEAMESAMLSALERAERARGEVEGLIRFVAVPWIIVHVLAPRLPLFWRRYPKVEVQAIADTRERLLDKGEVDLSLRFDTRKSSRVERIPVAEIPYAVYAPVGRDPSQLPWMGFREDEFRTKVESWLLEASEEEGVRFWANDAGILWQAVRAGAGKALLPEALVGADPALVRVSETQVVRTLWVQILPEVRRLRRMSLFLDWIRGALDDALRT